MRAGVWKNTQHLDVFGQTIGILGLGRIGRAMARRAAGFDMQRLYWDLERKADAEAEGIVYRPLDDLLAASDFVSVHLPFTPQTANILGRAEFARMKPTAVLVNTARGGIVDETALFDALSNGRIAGAASDVFAVEPANGPPLVELPNFIGTPHCAAATPGAYRNMAASCVDSILAVNAGKLPPPELVLAG
jgi:phosphoglycerate dehydrogenase-like enzyme